MQINAHWVKVFLGRKHIHPVRVPEDSACVSIWSFVILN